MAKRSPAEIQADVARLEARLPEISARLRRIPGVVDVKIGLRVRARLAVEEVVFQVFVERKRSPHDVPPQERIASDVLGVPVDVIELGRGEPLKDFLIGGSQVSDGQHTGTLGLVAEAGAVNSFVDPGKPVILTNHHVTPTVGKIVGGSSPCDCWCCKCCDFGRVVDSQATASVDAAISSINSGVLVTHDILGIGPARSSASATLNMSVVKFGITTNLTFGTVAQHTSPSIPYQGRPNMVGQILITPVAPPGGGAAPTAFADHGDSGSALVEVGTNRVVGLVHSKWRDSTGTLFVVASHMAAVEAAMKINVPLVGTAGSIPLAAFGELADREKPALDLAIALLRDRLQGELEKTAAGRAWLELLRTHAEEVRHLVNHDRETTIAWQRSHGPGFLAHYLKSVKEHGHVVPEELGGMRLSNLVVSMGSALQQRGSPELTRAVTENYMAALELAHGPGEDTLEKLAERARMLSRRAAPFRLSQRVSPPGEAS